MQLLVFLIATIWLFLYAPVLLAIAACGLVLMFIVSLAGHLTGIFR